MPFWFNLHSVFWNWSTEIKLHRSVYLQDVVNKLQYVKVDKGKKEINYFLDDFRGSFTYTSEIMLLLRSLIINRKLSKDLKNATWFPSRNVLSDAFFRRGNMELKGGQTEDSQGLALHQEGKWWRILVWWRECRILLSWEWRGSRWAGHRQFLQVVHEDLKADVISENRSPCLLLRQKGKTSSKKKKVIK